MKMLVSGYQSIDMHCIVVPVKFDGGLSIPFLRKKQLSQKNSDQKFTFLKVDLGAQYRISFQVH
jgi:hypothetical protein